jgi:hypothetical protein
MEHLTICYFVRINECFTGCHPQIILHDVSLIRISARIGEHPALIDWDCKIDEGPVLSPPLKCKAVPLASILLMLLLHGRLCCRFCL